MRITAIESQRNSAERVNVYVDGEFRCGVALELVRRAGLRSGDRVDAATLERLERADLAWKAKEAAYSLLAYRARTRAELRRRLSRKGFPEQIVEKTVDAMVEKGYVDDASFAESFARDRVRMRPSGPRRIVRELRAKGVAAEVAGPIVEEVFAAEDVSEVELAKAAAAKWARTNLRSTLSGAAGRRTTSRVKLRRRLWGHLARRGFRGDVIRTVVDDTLSDGGDDA